MNKRDKFQIIKHGHSMLLLWKRLIDEAAEVVKQLDWPAGRSSSWYKHETRQAYQDALNSLKNLGLIESYDVVRTRIKLEGTWYGLDDVPQQNRRRFVQSRVAK
jgi:hypothetical protein